METKIRINGDKNISHDKINARLGLTDKKNHSVFYLEGGAFITPETDYEDFIEIMDIIELHCKRSLKNKLFNDNIFENNFLMNFEVCSDRMKAGKNSYLSFQYHFKQKNNANESIITIKENHEAFFEGLLKDIEDELQSYDIKISKKRGLFE